jgi:hypothetical protein
MQPGYWQSTYWPLNYWAEDYWPEAAAGGPTGGGARYIKWNPLGFNLIRP